MNFGFGGGHRVIEALWAIGSFAVGLVFFLLWVGILFLLVRFLVIGTRAATFYLSSNGQHTGLLGSTPSSPPAPSSTEPVSTEPASTEPSAPTVTSPTPPSAPRVSTTKPRTPKTPPTPPAV